MPTGKLKKFVSDKGFGFITPDEGGDDIFAHTLQFSGDADGLKGGERVTYETEWDDRKGKTRAGKWSVDFSGAGGASMKTGKLKKYFSDKGFGFIEPDDGSEDLFAHSRQFSGGDPESLQEGDKVRYEEEWDSKKNKNKAGTWMLDNGGAPAGGGGAPGGGAGYGYPPPQGYGGPAPGYGGPPPYGGQPGYGAPPPGYGGPPPGGCYGPMGGAPPGGDPRYSPYGQPPGGYGAPGCYGAPAPGGYGAPAPGYGAPPGGAPSLPPGWEQLNDPASGKPYFCNRSTGETSWTPPAGAAAPAPAPAPAAAPPGGGAPPLPAGWESAPDPASGKLYYFNRASGETRWDPPR